ncbi:LysR family transcriptional regulator [Allorhodopirellula solitaria]|uniref:HTH-type transcriptional regulator MetR n=1 Tax=Allorhodopirellula solitaria TaxID=2527987 RepID=A0A5C5XP82_9BACT|nr:LysR family transcriptional regulator [Allorhodopirellula solitaria]TWT64714.1 HTH-type transcriptional regulator CynR [Allorhodopirellula solitaria]
MNSIERIHLEIVRAVDELGSLTAAAERLYVTQPALSHSIRKLEESIGLQVWTREGRSLRLTQAGEYVLSVAQRILPQFEQLELQLEQFAEGGRGVLRIGMECHPCYQWLLKIVAPYLEAWPGVDLDVKQKFQFGGVDALDDHEIDVLVTPDPVRRSGLVFEPVFDYEHVLVVGPDHSLCGEKFVTPAHLAGETIITYPVSADRLDVFSRFLTPAGMVPKRHKRIETTDIMLQMVASGRGVAALPRWLVVEQGKHFDLVPLPLGENGLSKQIFLGLRQADLEVDYVSAFLDRARAMRSNPPCAEPGS